METLYYCLLLDRENYQCSHMDCEHCSQIIEYQEPTDAEIEKEIERKIAEEEAEMDNL